MLVDFWEMCGKGYLLRSEGSGKATDACQARLCPLDFGIANAIGKRAELQKAGLRARMISNRQLYESAKIIECGWRLPRKRSHSEALCRRIRCTVDTPTPANLAVFKIPNPFSRNRITSAAFNSLVLGRPNVFP